MRFKDFIRMTEVAGGGAAGGGDNGLMGYPVASSVRKPSDGMPFKDKLTSIAGQTPRGPSGGGGGPAGGAPAGGPTFMKKRMKRK